MSANKIQTKARELKELKLMQEELAAAYTKATSCRRFSVR